MSKVKLAQKYLKKIFVFHKVVAVIIVENCELLREQVITIRKKILTKV
jgi:hypothetical protein